MIDLEPHGLKALYTGIIREQLLVDFYNRLANEAPNQIHKNNILYALECKRSNLNDLVSMFTAITGKQPEYQNNVLSFSSYEEGLRIAHQAELMDCERYQHDYYRCRQPHVQQILLQIYNQKCEDATRIGWLKKRVPIKLKDYGGQPFVVNIDEAAKQNKTYRTAFWTGEKLQVTLMSIGVGEDIGLEVHPTTDQFLRIEEGQGFVQMGDSPDQLDYTANVYDDFAIMIPAGKWHNLTNTGNKPIKLYAIYAPPEHPFGTVHETKAIAMAAEASE